MIGSQSIKLDEILRKNPIYYLVSLEDANAVKRKRAEKKREYRKRKREEETAQMMSCKRLSLLKMSLEKDLQLEEEDRAYRKDQEARATSQAAKNKQLNGALIRILAKLG